MNGPSHSFSNALSTGTQQYNNKKQSVTPSPNWSNYVQTNYHAARNTSGLSHNNTMKSLGAGYREIKNKKK